MARRPVSADILVHAEAASALWQRGDKALANLRLVFADLPWLDGPADADRLRLAEWLLDKGLPPRVLMKELGLDPTVLTLDKANYNPNQPRVPAGNGPESGRWEEIWSGIHDWLDQPVPEYDPDTGIQVGTQSREHAIATNPITVGVVGAAALLGVEAFLPATTETEVISPFTQRYLAQSGGRLGGAATRTQLYEIAQSYVDSGEYIEFEGGVLASEEIHSRFWD